MITPDLLQQSATAYTATGQDRDHNATWSEGVELGRIRIVDQDSRANGGEGKTITDTATLYFDCETSTPAGFIPAKGMRIEYGGRNYTVEGVKPARGITGSPEFYKADLK